MAFSPWWILLIDVLVAGPAVLHALLYKRHARAAMGWTVAMLTLPIVGATAYFLFGINRVRTRGRKLRDKKLGIDAHDDLPALPSADLEAATLEQPELQSLLRIGRAVTRTLMRDGNRVQPLFNGDEAYPAMLAAIDGATRYVHLLTYIFEHDDTGRTFIDALVRARARGVQVRVVLDGIGQLAHGRTTVRAMRRVGLDCRLYNPPRILPPQIYINLRNHRKILVCDGQIAFSGGMNISGRHLVRKPDRASPVQDLHFSLRGPIVSDLDALFRRDWAWAGDHRIETISMPPTSCQLEPTGGRTCCRLIPDGPDHDIAKLELVFSSVIGAAERRVVLVTPYFIPPESIMMSLVTAALRGVHVTVVIPAVSDHPWLMGATYRSMRWLLRNGVRVVAQPGPFAHTKLLLIDESYALIGSANIDDRSLRLNMELGVEVVDPAVVARLDEHLAPALERAMPITLETLAARSLPRRVLDGMVWLFSPYL